MRFKVCIPTHCRMDKHCRWHIRFLGCRQGPKHLTIDDQNIASLLIDQMWHVDEMIGGQPYVFQFAGQCVLGQLCAPCGRGPWEKHERKFAMCEVVSLLLVPRERYVMTAFS